MSQRNRGSYIDSVQKGGLPDQIDVYLQPELTDISVAYTIQNQQDFVHDVFGPVPVAKQAGKYRRYKPGSFMRNKMEKRADGAESVGSGFETDLLGYDTDVWAWHIDIGPQMRANAIGNTDVETAAAELCANAAMINAEVEWLNAYFKTGIWSTEYTFAAIPIGQQKLSLKDDASDPIAIMRAALAEQKPRAAGYRCNVCVMSNDVWERLLVHPKLRALWGTGQTPGGPTMGNPQVVRRQLAEYLEIDEIRVAAAVYTTSADGAGAETFGYMAPTGVGFFYRPARPSTLTPAAGYTFNWTGYLGAGSNGSVITREVIPLTKGAQRYEIERAYGYGLVAPDCGIWFQNPLA